MTVAFGGAWTSLTELKWRSIVALAGAVPLNVHRLAVVVAPPLVGVPGVMLAMVGAVGDELPLVVTAGVVP
jgi:hypothetical protein